jgi:hypothetical protein
MPKTQLKGSVDCTPEVYWYEAAIPKVKGVPRLSLEISTQSFDGKNKRFGAPNYAPKPNWIPWRLTLKTWKRPKLQSKLSLEMLT